jgi:flagellar motor protein MotB
VVPRFIDRQLTARGQIDSICESLEPGPSGAPQFLAAAEMNAGQGRSPLAVNMASESARILADILDTASGAAGACAATVEGLRGGQFSAALADCAGSANCQLPGADACLDLIDQGLQDPRPAAISPASVALGLIRESGVDAIGELVRSPHKVLSLVDFSYPWVRSTVAIANEADEMVDAISSRIPFAGSAVRAIAARYTAELIAIAAMSSLNELEARQGHPTSTLGLGRSACGFYMSDVRRPATTRAVLRRLILRAAPYDAADVGDYAGLNDFCSGDNESGSPRTCNRLIQRTGLVESLGLSSPAEIREAWVPGPTSTVGAALENIRETTASAQMDESPFAMAATFCATMQDSTSVPCDLETFNLAGGIVSLSATTGSAADSAAILSEIRTFSDELLVMNDNLLSLMALVQQQQGMVADLRDEQVQLRGEMRSLRESTERGFRNTEQCADAQGRMLWERLNFLEEMGFVARETAGGAPLGSRPTTSRDFAQSYRQLCVYGEVQQVRFEWRPSDADPTTAPLASVDPTFVCATGSNSLPLSLDADTLFASGEYVVSPAAERNLGELVQALRTALGADVSALINFSGFADPVNVGRRGLDRLGSDPSLAALRALYPAWSVNTDTDANRLLARARAANVARTFGVDGTEAEINQTQGAIDGSCSQAADSATGSSACRRVDLQFNAASAAWTSNPRVQSLTFMGCQ